MDDLSLTISADSVTFSVRLTPRASKNEITGVQAGALRVRLTAPPVEGAANAALIEFIAERLKVRKSAISIVSGERSRNKIVRVSGMNMEQVQAALRLA